jgi:hypothetical protein
MPRTRLTERIWRGAIMVFAASIVAYPFTLLLGGGAIYVEFVAMIGSATVACWICAGPLGLAAALAAGLLLSPVMLAIDFMRLPHWTFGIVVGLAVSAWSRRTRPGTQAR